MRWWLTPTWRCTKLHVSRYFYRKGFNKRICTFKFCESAVQSALSRRPQRAHGVVTATPCRSRDPEDSRPAGQ